MGTENQANSGAYVCASSAFRERLRDLLLMKPNNGKVDLIKECKLAQFLGMEDVDTIKAWLDGKEMPDLYLLELVAKFFDLPVGEFLGYYVSVESQDNEETKFVKPKEEEKPFKIIAVDFDGTLCENAWPKIGEPHWGVINALKQERQNGTKLILWTCREGDMLVEAVVEAMMWGLYFDAVNNNLQEMQDKYGNNPRKVSATEYWDDHSVEKWRDFVSSAIEGTMNADSVDTGGMTANEQVTTQPDEEIEKDFLKKYLGTDVPDEDLDFLTGLLGFMLS